MVTYQIHYAQFTMALFDSYSSFALPFALLLIGLLLLKELSAYPDGEGWRRLSRALNLAIAPLLLVFMFSVGMKIATALR